MNDCMGFEMGGWRQNAIEARRGKRGGGRVLAGAQPLIDGGIGVRCETKVNNASSADAFTRLILQ